MTTISTTAVLGQQNDPVRLNRFGPFVVGGAYYVVAPYYYNSYGLALAVFKASDPTSTWAEQDSTHHPASTNSGGSKSGDQLYSLDVVVRGTDLHMVWVYNNPFSGQIIPFYCKYSCSTDTWTITQEQVGTSLGNSGYQISLATRSDGSVLVANGNTGHWYTRPSGGGWTDQGVFYGSAGVPQVVHCVTGASDRVHIFYAYSGNNYLICHRSVESNNTLNSDQQNIGGGTNGAYEISPIAYLDGATTRLRVGCAWTSSASPFMAVLKANEGATPTWSVEEGGTTNGMQGPVALTHDLTTLYHFHLHTADSGQGVYYQSSVNNGGSWTPAGDTSVVTGVGGQIYGLSVSDTYVRGGFVCIGVVYGSYSPSVSPPLSYIEVQLHALSDAETSTGSDAVVLITVSYAETGTGTEGQLFVKSDGETGTGAEGGSLSLASTDTGAGSDASAPRVTFTASDSGAGAEAWIFRPSSSDTSTGAEAWRMVPQSSDVGASAVAERSLIVSPAITSPTRARLLTYTSASATVPYASTLSLQKKAP